MEPNNDFKVGYSYTAAMAGKLCVVRSLLQSVNNLLSYIFIQFGIFPPIVFIPVAYHPALGLLPVFRILFYNRNVLVNGLIVYVFVQNFQYLHDILSQQL